MHGPYLIIDEAMRYYIRQRADEIRALQHMPKPQTDTTIQEDLKIINIRASTTTFTGKMRYFLQQEPDNKQVFFVTDMPIVAISFKTKNRTLKLDELVQKARFELGDIFPANFNYAKHMANLFQHRKT